MEMRASFDNVLTQKKELAAKQVCCSSTRCGRNRENPLRTENGECRVSAGAPVVPLTWRRLDTHSERFRCVPRCHFSPAERQERTPRQRPRPFLDQPVLASSFPVCVILFLNLYSFGSVYVALVRAVCVVYYL